MAAVSIHSNKSCSVHLIPGDRNVEIGQLVYCAEPHSTTGRTALGTGQRPRSAASCDTGGWRYRAALLHHSRPGKFSACELPAAPSSLQELEQQEPSVP